MKIMNHIPKKRTVTDAEKIKAFTESNEANMPAMLLLFKDDAKIQRAKFDAYLTEGFTADQAIQLCTR